MKLDEGNVEKILDRAVTRHGNLSQSDVDSAMDRAWKNLQPDMTSAQGWTIVTGPSRRISPLRLAFALSAAAMVLAGFLMIPILIHKVDASATVESGDGKLLQPGQRIDAGKIVSAGGTGAMLMLADGSHVEMRAGSTLLLEGADDGVRVRLNNGGVIVTAAKQRKGHLYVQTKDVTASVVGTVFLVNAEEAGSRVAVIQGEVHVQQGSELKQLLPGEQVASNPLMESQLVSAQISWSRYAEEHLVLLQRSAVPTATAENPSDGRIAFEEASIKAGSPRLAGAPVYPCGGGISQYDPRHFVVKSFSIYRLIAQAYGKACLILDLSKTLSGGPDWIRSEQFDIEALIPEGSPAYARDQVINGEAPNLQMMIQTLLTDRFRLTLHREMKEIPVYNLVVVKNGKMKLSEDQSSPDLGAFNPTLDASRLRGHLITRFTVSGATPGATVSGSAISISQLTDWLQTEVGRIVLDKTGLKGLYDIPSLQTSFMSSDGPGTKLVLPQIEPDILEPLGLKLESAKAPVEVLVIDHVEKPSKN